MIEQLRLLHSCGYIHNDLKPENILLRSKDAKDQKSSEIVLIDFGIASEYKCDLGQHVECSKSERFKGNLLF
jgi:serine/threonine protein kinase